MATEREQDESDESMDESHESSHDTDAPDDSEAAQAAQDDEDEEQEREDDGRILTRPEDEASTQAPARNRAERRAARKRDAKPAREDRNAKVAEQAVPGGAPRVRVPPRRTSGKSNANSDDTPAWATATSKWITEHRSLLMLGVLVLLVGGGVGAGWMAWNQRVIGKAASAYTDAIQVATAPIRAADAPPEPATMPPHHGPTYVDRTARSQAALQAFRGVEQKYPSTGVGRFAKLSEASTLYDLGRYAEARRLYESLLGADMGGEEGTVLEGLGFTLEALHDFPAALQRYSDLSRLQDGAWRDIAAYHQARVEQQLGHNDRAKDLLHGVIERARHSMETDERSATAGSGSIHEQAVSLLRDIDPSDTMAQPAAAPHGGTPNFDRDAIMRALMQQAQQRGHAPGPGGAAPPHAPAPVPNMPAPGGH